MATTDTATTPLIHIGAEAFYLLQESDPAAGKHLFAYRIKITNASDVTVQLLSRHWIIIDGDGHTQEVRGEGVIGKQPVLPPGGSFEYQSFCPLDTGWGTMEGSYQFRRDDGVLFDAPIPRFFLVSVQKHS